LISLDGKQVGKYNGRIRVVPSSPSSQTLNNSKVVGKSSMSLIENPKIRFRNSSSTPKSLFDKYESINQRRRRKNRVKLGREISVRMSDKMKIAKKYFLEVRNSNVMKERVVSTNNVVLRVIQKNKRRNLTNVV